MVRKQIQYYLLILKIFNLFMKSLILPLIFVGLLSIALADYQCTTESYAAYRQAFGKNQDLTPEKYQAKFAKFCWNIEFVANLNSQSHTSTHGINQFSDYLDEENKKLLNAKLPTGEGASKTQLAAKVTANMRTGGTPANWRSKSSSIKNQGTCGSCWAFTTVGLYETLLKVKGKQEYDLSQQFILQCTNELQQNSQVMSDCQGGYVDYSLQVVKNYGIPLQTAWPYLAGSYGSIAGKPSSPTPGICSTTQNFIFEKDMKLTRFDNTTVAQIQTLLADGPLGALMTVDAAFQSYTSGIYTGCPASFATAHAAINHAVIIVGMDANKNYIIKNSWGPGWGDSGFATISSTADCALSAFVFQLTMPTPPPESKWGYQLLGSTLMLLLALLMLS